MTGGCKARQYSDQMQCGRCGLAWDVSDPEPPECLTDKELQRQRGREALDNMKRSLSDEAN